MTRGPVLMPAEATDPALAGGKAAALAALDLAGFAPPPFRVVHYDRALDDRDIAQILEGLGDGPFAVRSSGIGEDATDLSYAGQFLTELNVEAADLAGAIARVRRSGVGATAYTSAHGDQGTAGIGVNVIVQKMVQPRAAGVAFSADPVSGVRGRAVITAVAGLADRLVAGEVDGQTWVLGPDNTAIEAPAAGVIDPAIAGQIADLARRAEGHFGAPQDIEWALDEAGLHILQSRPITTRLRPPPADDTAPQIFDNSNIVESYPGVVSPLTYSFAVYVYARVYRSSVRLLGVSEDTVRANGAVFDNMLGRIDGRVYYNLINWYRTLSLLPGFSLNRGYMETMMGVSEPMPAGIVADIGPPAATRLQKLQDVLRLGRAAFDLLWQAMILPRTKRRFYQRLNRALQSSLDLDRAPLTALAAEYRAIEAELLERWDAPLVNDFLCMIGFGASRNLLGKWLGDAGLQLHNDVMIGQGDIVSAEPAQRIKRIAGMIADAKLGDAVHDQGMAAFDAEPKIRREVEAYLDRFGDRCIAELKLESLSLRDNPAPLLDALLAQSDGAATDQRAASPPDWAALFQGRPVRRWIARGLVGWAKARVRDRENLRFERTRLFGHARRMFLAMGRELTALDQIDDPRDIFSLTVSEVLGAIEGFAVSADLKSLVAIRKAEDEAARAADPPERISLSGPALGGVLAVERRSAPPDVSGTHRTGTGCSAGQVSGVARVITDPANRRIAKGEILVARHTDPGWIALFANAAAIVVERGSLLSHSAIVARELGIPSVVALKDATRWIADGERIDVDGATGVVRKLDV